MNRFDEISALLQKGRPRELSALVQEELADGTAANDILTKALIPGMSAVGERFKKNEIFVPEVLITARAMNAALNILKPVLAQAGVEPIGKAVICTVKGDLHDIGKNLVKMMIEGTGISVIDLGIDCPPERVVEAVKEYKPDIVCLSALLTTTMVNQKATIDALKEAGLRDQVKVMVGGAPVTQALPTKSARTLTRPTRRRRRRSQDRTSTENNQERGVQMKLTVLTGERTVVFEAERGKSLGRLFSMHGIHIPMRCGGNGTCGKCKVKLLEGRVSGAQPDEGGLVLACRAAVPTNYISSAGCEVPRDTPPENLLAVADALREEGAN